MKREIFLERFDQAIEESLSKAREVLVGQIPEFCRFELEYRDGHKEGLLTSDEAINILYKNEKVPRWVNIFFSRVEDDVSIIGCELSDDYFRDDKDLLYEDEGLPPFRVGNPWLPDGFQGKNLARKI